MNTDSVDLLMDALSSISRVPGTELEQRALKFKIKALQDYCTDGLTGKALINAMSDEALAISILDGDESVGCGRPLNPALWQHICSTRPKALNIYARLHLDRGGIISGLARSSGIYGEI